jgi:hypothetical protein
MGCMVMFISWRTCLQMCKERRAVRENLLAEEAGERSRFASPTVTSRVEMRVQGLLVCCERHQSIYSAQL